MLSREGSASEVLAGARRWHVGHGDALTLLAELPENSIDAMVTDPPAGVAFMGKDWDNPKKLGEGGFAVELRHCINERHHPNDMRSREREVFVWWLSERLSAAYRVLKPGAHALIWSLPRTTHWTGLAIEQAGFEVIDQIAHLFSQGASKSKSAKRMLAMLHCTLPGRHHESSLPKPPKRLPDDHICADHVEAGELDGYGTGLAPSHEGWWLVRKPLEGTIAENLERYGTGVIDIDGARIPTHNGVGRWPKNALLSHTEGCKKVGTAFVGANPSWDTPARGTAPALFTGPAVSKVRHTSREGEPSAERRYTGRGTASLSKTPGARRDDFEEVNVWQCESGCTVLALAEQGGDSKSGTMKVGTLRTNRFGYTGPMPELTRSLTIGDEGPVTRFYLQLPREEPGLVPFYYQAKPTRAEKDAGLSNFRTRSGAEVTGSEEDQVRLENPRTGAGRGGSVKNMHGTTKSEALLRYFVRLVSRKGGVVLDLFCGSGTAGVAAVCEGRRFIGMDISNTDEEPHVEIARGRIQHADGGGELVPRESLRETERDLGVLGGSSSSGNES